ncbi:MAG TPA: MarR family transcriptional regulator [Planctomycetota bacterium]|nr:MarR family transcriptional regulator [Planctomycetota bacterium]
MEADVLRDSEAFLVQLRRMRLEIVGWAIRRLGPTGVNFPQYALLAVLDEMGEATMTALAGRLGTTLGAATNLVDRLVRSGHVERERSTTDRRVVNVRCTAKGRELLGEVTTDTAAFLGGLFGQVPPEDRRTVIEVCRKIVALMDAGGGA